MFPIDDIMEDSVARRIAAAAGESVRRSLEKDSPSPDDILNLVSPAAEELLGEIRILARRRRLAYFGRTMKLYMPLYVSNFCINGCTYCGYGANSKAVASKVRRRLAMKEVFAEAEIIRSYGIDSVLIVSGEDPEYVDGCYLAEVSSRLKGLFSYVAAEIFPLTADGYKRLRSAGVDGLTLYQETYDRQVYSAVHPSGPKNNYDRRLRAVEDAADAGFYNIGIGALLGLSDWRTESYFLASHAAWLRKKYWKCRLQFSFPRIRDESTGFKIPAPLTELNLEQMILAFRIVFPECDISLSTRESADFRRNVAENAVNIMSAASSVVPGGYRQGAASGLGQFKVCDSRPVAEVEEDLRGIGIEPVFKDWDPVIG